MAPLDERLADLFRTRQLDLQLPIGLERRIRAHIHRLNATIAVHEDDIEPLQMDGLDFEIVLLTLVESALDETEAEVGTRYDHLTGRPMPILRETR